MKKQYSKSIFFLSLLLLVGFLAHSLIFFVLNQSYNPYRLGPGEMGDAQLHQIYTTGRRIAESIVSLCGTGAVFGNFLFLFFHFRKRSLPSPQVSAACLLTQIAIVLLCTAPFGFWDAASRGDYLFPAWSVLIELGILWIAAIFYGLRKSRRSFS